MMMDLRPSTSQRLLLCPECHTLIQEGQWNDRKQRCPYCPTKYHARLTRVDEVLFHSRKEANRYQELVLLQRAGYITCLHRQVTFPLMVTGVTGEAILIGSYVADHVYQERLDQERITGEEGEELRGVVEEVKSNHTIKLRTYHMQRALMLACYGIHIREVV